MTDPIKFCINCRHHSMVDRCRRPMNEIDVLSGQPYRLNTLCRSERQTIGWLRRVLSNIDQCGIEGKYFEPIGPEDRPPPSPSVNMPCKSDELRFDNVG